MIDPAGREQELPPFEANQQHLLTGDPGGGIPTGAPAAGSDAGGGAAGAETEGSPPLPTSNVTQTTPSQSPFDFGQWAQGQPTSNLFTPGQGGSLQGLMAPVQQQGTQVQTGLGEAAQAFQTLAGPQRSYESVGAQGTLEQAISPDTPEGARGGAQEAARELLGSTYGGPAGLNQGAVTGLQGDINNIRTQSGALRTGSGLMSLLGEGVPGLTPGQARFEAQRIQQQPGYRQSLRELAQIPRSLSQDVAKERTVAEQYATQRAHQEAGIAGTSKDYLRGEESGLEDIWSQRMEPKNQLNLDIEAAFQSMLDKQDISEIEPYLQYVRAIGEEGLEGGERVTMEGLTSPIQTDVDLAAARKQKIMDKYPDIADMPVWEPMATHRGKVTYGIPQEGGALTPNLQAGLTPEQFQMGMDRQHELENYFTNWSPGRANPFQKGIHRATDPLYFGDPIEAGNIAAEGQDYWEPKEGKAATRETEATEGERYKFNTINDLLGEVERLDEAQEPWRAAMVAVELERFFEAENQRRTQKRKDVSASEKEYSQKIGAIRKKYKKLRSAKKWGQIADALSYIPVLAPQYASLILKSVKDTHGPETGREELKQMASTTRA